MLITAKRSLAEVQLNFARPLFFTISFRIGRSLPNRRSNLPLKPFELLRLGLDYIMPPILLGGFLLPLKFAKSGKSAFIVRRFR